MNESVRIKSVRVTSEIINILSETGGLNAKEVADRLEMPVSTVYDYLQTLENIRYVKNQEGKYCLSFRFLKYGELERYRNKLTKIARPKMKQLADKTGELTTLQVEEFGKGVQLAIEEGEIAVDFHTVPGVSLYLHATALGKAILAHLPDERRTKIIDQHGLQPLTPNTITNRDTLLEDLSEIRNQGFAIDHSESVENVSTISAPVLDLNGNPHGAIGISSPTSKLRNDGQYKNSIIEDIIEAVEHVQVQINYS